MPESIPASLIGEMLSDTFGEARAELAAEVTPRFAQHAAATPAR